MEIEEHIKFSLLFDTYGKLLSPKQFMVMDKFLNCDLSESELAELDKGSRQSIYDAMKKAKKQLLEFEEKLHFLKDSNIKKDLLIKLKSILKNDNFDKNKVIDIIDKIINE